MGTDVYVDHGIHVRRIALDLERGPGYEIHVGEGSTRLTRVQFKKMLFALLSHLFEVSR